VGEKLGALLSSLEGSSLGTSVGSEEGWSLGVLVEGLAAGETKGAELG
jgi:hypothetical protein